MAAKVSLRHHFVEEIPQNISDDEDLTDDSTRMIPMIGLKTPAGLLDRFVKRLAKIAAANVKVHGSEDQMSIEIHLSRNGGSDQIRVELDRELHELLQTMEESLATITRRKEGPASKQAEEELWDSILIYSCSNIDHIVPGLRNSFESNQGIFEELVTKMFGVLDNDNRGSAWDRELGERIIAIYQAVHGYDKSMKQLHDLIQLAATMIMDIRHLRERMKYLLLKAKFANELYDLILTLGSPDRAFHTFVRAAKTCPAFSKLTFHLPTTPPTSPPQERVCFTNPTASTSVKLSTSSPKPALKPSTTQTSSKTPSPIVKRAVRAIPYPSPPRPQQPAPQQPRKTSNRTTSSVIPSISPPVPQNDIFEVVRPHLAEEDRALGLPRLQPASKQDSAQLAGAVLRGKLLPMTTNAWHTFGFVTTHSECEERTLGGLYAAILTEASNSQAIFREIVQVVETNTLINLITTKEYGHILTQLSSSLVTFLATPPQGRSTVWRLKQFVNDNSNTSPPPHLQRDYGFKYCRQHDEVQHIKDVYWNLLKTVDPMDLHNACVYGRLYEFASARGCAVPKDRRLMQNDWPASHIGLENDKGLAAYLGPFFRRR